LPLVLQRLLNQIDERQTPEVLFRFPSDEGRAPSDEASRPRPPATSRVRDDAGWRRLRYARVDVV